MAAICALGHFHSCLDETRGCNADRAEAMAYDRYLLLRERAATLDDECLGGTQGSRGRLLSLVYRPWVLEAVALTAFTLWSALAFAWITRHGG